jgi:hypothetical protein
MPPVRRVAFPAWVTLPTATWLQHLHVPAAGFRSVHMALEAWPTRASEAAQGASVTLEDGASREAGAAICPA